jgi:hypothetical protein
MSYLMDPRLRYIPDEVRRLDREASDAEWNNDPRLEAVIRELNHMKELQDAGELYEPTF